MHTTYRRLLTHLALVFFSLFSVAQEARVGHLTGHAANGKKLYRRFCVGCHGPLGDGNGDNAQWIDPKPRDFTAATFKCRSTPPAPCPPTKIFTTQSDAVSRIPTCRTGMR